MPAKKRREALTQSPDRRLRHDSPRLGPAERTRPDLVLLAILAAAFVVRLGVLLQLHDHPLLRPSPEMDAGAYLDLARRVAGGDLLAGDRVFFVSPLYIYFEALVLVLSRGSTFAVQVLQVMLGTAAVWLVADTARVWFGRRGGWVAGGLAAATGYFAFNESLLLQSSLDPVLTALGLWALAKAWTRGGTRLFAAAGLALGLHALNRPNVLAWVAVAVAMTAAATLWDRRKPWIGWIPVAALLGGLFLPMAPVALRNYAVGGRLALVASHGGLNFYIGNNPRADGTYRLVAGITPSIAGQDRDMRRVAEQAVGHPVDDVEASGWFYGQAWDWIGAHPATALALFGRKVAYVFNAQDIPLNDSFTYYATDESLLLRALAVGPWLLLPLGLAGIWFGQFVKSPSRDSAEWPMAWWAWTAFVPVYAVSVAIFFVAGRYRLPLLMPCCVTGAGTVLALLDAWRAARWRDVAVTAGAAALLAVGVNVNLGLDNGLAGWRAEMVFADIQAGKDEEARALLAKTEPIYPNRGLLLYRVGRAYAQRGDAGQALAAYERGLAIEPDRGELRLAAGDILLQLGRASEAIPMLEAARKTPAVEDRAALALARALAASGRVGEGMAALRSLRAPGRLDVETQLAAGRFALENGDGATAQPFLERAVALAPGRADLREAYGLSLAMQGRKSEAVAVLEEACRLDAGSASSRLNLAILYAETGRIGQARAAAEAAIRLRPDYDQARQLLAMLDKQR